MYKNKKNFILKNFLSFIFVFLTTSASFAIDGDAVQQRMKADVKAGQPLVAHVIVALADNKHQSIVPTTQTLGNGQDPKRNLYWGAMYGVDAYLPSSKGGWKRVTWDGKLPDYILQRSVFYKILSFNGRQVEAYIIADAWDGKYIQQATKFFLDVSEGAYHEKIEINPSNKLEVIHVGSHAHLVAYIGHNVLMDHMPLDKSFITQKSNQKTHMLAKSTVILACQSKRYFTSLLEERNVHPLILTTTNMAPEAYTLDALLKKWFAGRNVSETHLATAKAYQAYQNISLKAAKNLFFSQ